MGSPSDEYIQDGYVPEDDGSVVSCDCGFLHLGGRWFLGAIVFEAVFVIGAMIALYYAIKYAYQQPVTVKARVHIKEG
jgi:hypothetical protein